MLDSSSITQHIPHRPPFLFVDQVLERKESTIRAQKTFTGTEDFFKGHYPEYPILPGVIACEAIFQTGAILMAHILSTEKENGHKVPVLTRITKAKFKDQILPPATIEIQVELKEKVMFAYFMQGKILHQGKTAVEVEFSVAMVEQA
ncbi:MAG: 3-hydroxyacyl-ACP dehydratase FabZ family protein, partial [Planctomycetota bacterium]